MHNVTLLTSEFAPFRGGIGSVAMELAHAASALGVDIKVVAPDYNATPESDSAYPFNVERFAAGPYSGRQMATYMRVALHYARQPHEQHIIAVDSPFLESLALTFPLHGKPFDAILHGSEIVRAQKFPRSVLASYTFGKPKRLIANSRFTKSLVQDDLKSVPEEKVTVALLGVADFWRQDVGETDIREKLNLGSRQIIVSTGRITARKGQLDLLRALNEPAMNDEIKGSLAVVIAGKAMPADAEYLAAIKAKAKELGPVDVIIRDDLDNEDIRALYSEASVFCLPGSAKTAAVEGFGLVFLEAAAQGLPAIAGRVGGVPEAVLDGLSGLLVPPDRPQELGKALAKLLKTPTLRASLSKGASEYAKKSTWEKFAQITLGIQ